MDQGNGTVLAILLATDLDSYYERLVVIYQDQLYAYAFGITKNYHDAEDIVQEVFLRAYEALDGYSVQRIRELKVCPWLYKITKNVCFNYVTRRRLLASIPLHMLEGSIFPEIEDNRSEQPEIVMERVEGQCQVEVLLRSLPHVYREVIDYYYLKNLSHKEIADLLKQRVGTIRVKMHRGLHVLRRMLQDDQGSEYWKSGC